MELKEGQIVNARVSGMQPYGAFVEMEDGKSGLVFIEDLSVVRIKSPKDRVKIGQEIQCKVKSIDKKTGKFKRLCFLENKVKIFNELYPNAHIDNFYTDSMNDKAMMDIADHVYLVNGNKIEQIK